MNKNLILSVFAFGLFGCNQREASKANTDLLYFDLKGYFVFVKVFNTSQTIGEKSG